MTTVITSQVRPRYAIRIASAIAVLAMPAAHAQLTDQTQTPNAENAGIVKSLEPADRRRRRQRQYAGLVHSSSSQRDPARSIRRGRQLFQRKFTLAQGFGPRTHDGIGDIGGGRRDRRRPDRQLRGLSRPSARLGGLRRRRGHAPGQPRRASSVRARAAGDARGRDHHGPAHHPRSGHRRCAAIPHHRHAHAREQGHQLRHDPGAFNGTVDTSGVDGVDPDLRVRPFFAQGGTISIREFVVGAFNDEMGLQAVDPMPRNRRGRRARGDAVRHGARWLASTASRRRPPAAPRQDPDDDGKSRTSCPPRSSITWSSTCSTTSSRASTGRPHSRSRATCDVQSDRLHVAATSRT